MSEEKPTIDCPETGPFVVKGLRKLTDAENQPVPMQKEVIALCRCGESQNKPFCDGTHADIGFSGENQRSEDSGAKQYAGAELTVIDNRGVCCHAGACVEGAPDVFFKWEGDERVSAPDKADKETVIATIRRCPSGSLAYKLGEDVHDQYFSEPEIFISKDGPLHVRGGVVLNDAEAPVSASHYTLCRCGASKNKPYCDGTHSDVDFKD